MTIQNFLSDLADTKRLLLETELEPIQGTRFQPTGFPDLGPAEFERPDGTSMLLVESNQSMANRLEEVCWDEAEKQLVDPLQGLPYVHVELREEEEEEYTNSLLEAHRINSEYITGNEGDDEFTEKLEEEIGWDDDRPVKWEKFHRVLLKYDVNSLVHGVMLEEIGGRLRVPRMLSAFIEAENVNRAESGGVKFSRVNPSAGEGEGNVPYPKTRYTADEIIAYFNVDLDGLRNLGLPGVATNLLTALSLYKVRRFLEGGIRLRSECDLQTVSGLTVTRPENADIPSTNELEDALPDLISTCRSENLFSKPPVTRL